MKLSVHAHSDNLFMKYPTNTDNSTHAHSVWSMPDYPSLMAMDENYVGLFEW